MDTHKDQWHLNNGGMYKAISLQRQFAMAGNAANLAGILLKIMRIAKLKALRRLGMRQHDLHLACIFILPNPWGRISSQLISP